MRLFVSASLIIAWAMPALTATIVWQWMFDTEYGLVNWALDRQGESWLAEPAHVLHGRHDHRRVDGHPVRRLHDVRRAHPDPRGHHRGGPARRRRLPRHASATSSFPALKPILLILTSLSVIWDFRVFTQIYVLQRAGGITRDTNLLGVYAYRISIGENRFDIGAAVAVVMVADHDRSSRSSTCGRWCARRSCERARAERATPPSDARARRNGIQRRRARSSFAIAAVPRVLDGAHVVQAQQRGPAR